MAVGQITLFLSELLAVAAKVMVSRPSGPIRRESHYTGTMASKMRAKETIYNYKQMAT